MCSSHLSTHTALMCSSHLSTYTARYFSPVSRDAKLSSEQYFMSSKCQKRYVGYLVYVRYLEFGARNNYRIFISVLFILSIATSNFDGNQNKLPLISLLLKFCTFQLLNMFSGTNYVQKLGIACNGRMRLKCDGTHTETRFRFWRNGRVHLNQRGRQFSRLLAAEACVWTVVMLDTPCSEVVWRALATHSIRQFPLHFPSCASLCVITFQLDSTANQLRYTELSETNFLIFRLMEISRDK